MFTKNLIDFMKTRFLTKSYGEYFSMQDVSGASKRVYMSRLDYANMGGAMRLARCGTIQAVYNNSYADPSQLAVYFGSGATPPTLNDYKLEAPITSGLSITNPASVVVVEEGNGKYAAIADYIVRNTSAEEKTIYEVGAFVALSAASQVSTTYQDWCCMMVDRTVLTEPIVIPAGESKLVTYKVTFNQTLNVD